MSSVCYHKNKSESEKNHKTQKLNLKVPETEKAQCKPYTDSQTWDRIMCPILPSSLIGPVPLDNVGVTCEDPMREQCPGEHPRL